MPDCAPGMDGFLHLARQAYLDRVPLNATLELTRRCNLRCVHCYAGPGMGVGANEEMSLADWRRVIKELTDAGCLMALLTGGEPLARKDFGEIYRCAKENGLVVTLFTNATLVDKDTANFLRSMPPRDVDVTLYGSTAETYERITGCPGSFERCIRGVKTMLDAGVRVTLKSVLMTLNEHEFEDIEKLARSLGGGFRMDALVSARYGGDCEPLKYRVAPETAAAYEFGSEDRRRGWASIVERPDVENDGRLFACGAGRRSCHISADGSLFACLMEGGGEGYDLRNGSFADGWENNVRARVEREASEDFPCRECNMKKWCGYCPMYVIINDEAKHEESSWLCRLAVERKKRALKVRSAGT